MAINDYAIDWVATARIASMKMVATGGLEPPTSAL